MKKILLILMSFTILCSLQGAHAGSPFVSSIYFDDDNVTQIQLKSIFTETETKNTDIIGKDYNIEFTSKVNTYLCQGSDISIIEQVMDGISTKRVNAKCLIEAYSAPKDGLYNINIKFSVDSSLDFSVGNEYMINFSDVTEDSNNSCTADVEKIRNSLAISHSGINLQTAARLKNALEKFYNTVETRFDSYDKQVSVYNEILDRINYIRESRNNSKNAEYILSVIETNIGYRIEEQKDVFSCKNDGVDFESLLDVNLD